MPISSEELVRRARFGDALKAAMERKGTTQARLAEAMDLNQTTISSWMRGSKRPRYREEVERLERALGPRACTPGSLVAILYPPPRPGAPAALSGINLEQDLTSEELAQVRGYIDALRAQRSTGE